MKDEKRWNEIKEDAKSNYNDNKSQTIGYLAMEIVNKEKEIEYWKNKFLKENNARISALL